MDDGVRFSRPFYISLLVICVVLIIFDRPAQRSELLSTARARFNDVAAPVLELTAQPMRGIGNIGPWWRRQIELARENQQLREDLSELRAWRDVALSLRDRTQAYEEALNVQAPSSRRRITAWTVAERSGPFVRARLIGVGAEDGVREGYPALNIYGLIGRTVDVGRQSARILLLTDLNSRVAVMADRSNARALLVGDNSDFPRLEYLGREPDLVEGDRIVTSGDDNVMPRGLPVGEAVRDRDGRWRVALYSRAAPTDLVWIWPFQPIEPPEADPVEDADAAAPPAEEPPAVAAADDSPTAPSADDDDTGGG
ncbi:rod shape-determining protein MreC [Marinicauda salina]|uniref:Cell shape-determining protein MreC n=1 Tax=Marinicauda salina TaxID=2135793 RepID=A0A2U2BST7_9PROT|nr:rod shape-determining protein MreC [Marinicauda salina]PWE17056.1 rod shape-determining protein MreC [Marinicauda salina]